MTDAQRQARHRQHVKEAAKQAAAAAGRGGPTSPPARLPKGQGKAALGGAASSAPREFGFEEGAFVDGALVSSYEVIALVEMSPPKRKERLDEARRATKADACMAVRSYMAVLHVSLDDLVALGAG
jgi:hypothetical protein